MKITLLSSPQNGVKIIEDRKNSCSLDMINFVVEIECPDLRLFREFTDKWANNYRQDTQHSHCGEVFYCAPKEIASDEEMARLYFDAVADAACSYQMLLEAGASPDDAAAVLPAGALARATAVFNLYALHHYATTCFPSSQEPHGKRLFSELRSAILREHAWAHPFLQ